MDEAVGKAAHCACQFLQSLHDNARSESDLPPVKIGISIFGTVSQKNIQGIGRWFSDQFPDFLSFKLWRKWLFIIDQRYFQTTDSKAVFSHLQAAGFIMQDMDPAVFSSFSYS